MIHGTKKVCVTGYAKNTTEINQNRSELESVSGFLLHYFAYLMMVIVCR